MGESESVRQYRTRVERDVPVKMRDGTVLAADVYRPDSAGEFPVLIERTPYSKAESSETKFGAGEYYSSRGYACVFQDVRGRFGSGGDFYPFKDDGGGGNRDGYDTVEWAAEQTWSNGKVGMIGGSYSGATQYRVHADSPPHLAAQFVRQSSSDYSNEWVYRNGVFELGFNMSWATRHTATNVRKWSKPEHADSNEDRINRMVAGLQSEFERLPLKRVGVVADLAPWWTDWLDHPESGSYWDEFNISPHWNKVEVPVAHLGGWYDGFLRGTLQNFAGMVANAKTELARKEQHLIVGPWVHAPDAADLATCGEADFGPEAPIGFMQTRLEWFDYWLKGIENGLLDRPPVRLFAMGGNRWRTFDEWPPRGATPAPFYLRAARANACRSLNDGSLTTGPASQEPPDSYEYDPANPVPTQGGAHLGSAADGAPNGQMDQRPIHDRVLSYTGPVLEHELDVTGEVTAILFAKSSAPDTDWIVKLIDVHPDGRAMLVCDGVIRARYRRSREAPELLNGDVEKYEIDLWGTSYIFKRGHRVQVVVTSSDFPRWDRNMNTGGINAQESKSNVAFNSVFHDAEHPSHILLPLM